MQDNEGLTPGLMVVHGNRLEELRELAVAWMRSHPLAPLENEVVLVQSNGIAQWLKLALAAQDGCGIAAAIQVELPARFLWQTYRAVLGSESIPRESPLDKAPLTWRLMRLLPGLLAGEAFAPLRRFLDGDADLRKRHQLAERLADLFDQYQVYRADWLADWAAGHDRLRTSRGGAQPLDEAVRWQPALWRALLADVGREQLAESRAGVHPRFVERLRTVEALPPGLPRRVIVFGISSLPAQTVEALAALARFSQVLLCVHNPCRHHWGDIVPDQDLLRHQYRRQQRKGGMAPGLSADELHQHAHPLLAAWGKQGRDYINLLDMHDDPEHYRERFAILGGRIDLFGEGDTTHLLGQLQDDILHLRTLAETREQWPPLDPAADRSLRFQIAHSAQREVEILHDQLLDRFAADPSLRPREVIVMVPDVNAYAPHIQAVFGQYAQDDDRYIPFTLADQGQRGCDPLPIAVEHLLKLPEGRLTVSEVLDLLDVPALRARFAIDESELPTLHRWIEGAGIRWGLDAERRAALGLPEGLEQNTWRFGLRRMLLGYAVGRGAACAGIEPFDEIGGLDAALIGPLVQLLDALDALHRRLAQPAAPAEWGRILHAMLGDFFVAQNERDETLLGQLVEALEEWLELCAGVGLEEPLPLGVVREAWLGTLDQGRLSQRFLAGAVNFCTLMPMRAIPFRMVCLLGMNDGDYPRSQTPLDFDLMAGDYRPGDRSRREDDRYLLLEALLAAREQLYVSWVGRSIRDNAERPASVLVGQLRDHLASGWTLGGDGDLLAALTTEHPLQPFSRRYFDGDGALFSYAREWAALHRRTPAAGAARALPPFEPDGALALETLQNFLRDPVKHFFTQRLKVHLDEELQAQLDEEPFGLDGLELHQLRRELLGAASLALEAHPEQVEPALQAAALRLQRSGRLPLAGFGERLRESVLKPLPEQIERYRALCADWPQRLDSPKPLQFEHAGVELQGWLGGLRAGGGEALARIELQPGKLQNKDQRWKWHRLLRPWVAHVAAAACGLRLTTLLVGEDTSLKFAPIEPAKAQAILRLWLEAWRAGLEAPLPVALNTAIAWLNSGEAGDEDGGTAEKAAREAYEGGYKRSGEVAGSASLARHYPTFDALVADGDFYAWSRDLYQSLLDHPPEELTEEACA
ncbi:DNA helicase/exodeoxyribonuclease V, gamma subunit [Azotobacter beijerinckii]|uniref:RecBCD enzyme subunit RecC n=1 Tax=Azotobacter beijerinckii TaxID=170623 RepID=A0A1H6QH69_9GAMM|nr:exodeoxyribonuclease V subunit gamma [Azotobacter beijerinckii]SEI39557.1 DNA helicase/exodeoxyribonuclease V, gamma subunit [Azotobacter beijerinckii]